MSRVVPPFRGIDFSSAGILWIIYGVGTDRSLKLKLCCTGAVNNEVVNIDTSKAY